MRAKSINKENQFQRGGDTRGALGIGKTKAIEELLLETYGDRSKFDFRVLKDGNIEITYYLHLSTRKIYKYLAKYEERDAFFTDEWAYESKSFSHSLGTYYYHTIKKVEFNPDRWGDNTKFVDSIFIKLDKNPENKEYIEYINECLNKKYTKVKGLIFIKSIEDDIKN